VRKVASLAPEMVVYSGFCEADSDRRYNSAVCVSGDGILGHHRKVHQPGGESAACSAGDRFLLCAATGPRSGRRRRSPRRRKLSGLRG
jgi:predicted amidohydrolase